MAILRQSLLVCLVLLQALSVKAQESTQTAVKPNGWVVYYGEALPAADFVDYDIIAFDSQNHPPLRTLINRGKTILGYMSGGEAEEYRKDFAEVKALGVLLEPNEKWPGHYVVDIRNPAWTRYLIENKIPEILFKRFDGIMIDTLDSPLHLEEIDPKKYAGMKEAAIAMIQEIRLHYPHIKIMVNRAFPILPEVAEPVDMVLAESLLTKAEEQPAEEGAQPRTVYSLHSEEETASYHALIDQARQLDPSLQVYTLDYWDPADANGIKQIYTSQRQRGYIPYVSTPDLMKVYREPQ
jgi:polysaccharide biosynthesis protein PelA